MNTGSRSTGAVNSLVENDAFMSSIQKAIEIVRGIRERGERHFLADKTLEDCITRLLNRGLAAPSSCTTTWWDRACGLIPLAV